MCGIKKQGKILFLNILLNVNDFLQLNVLIPCVCCLLFCFIQLFSSATYQTQLNHLNQIIEEQKEAYRVLRYIRYYIYILDFLCTDTFVQGSIICEELQMHRQCINFHCPSNLRAPNCSEATTENGKCIKWDVIYRKSRVLSSQKRIPLS